MTVSSGLRAILMCQKFLLQSAVLPLLLRVSPEKRVQANVDSRESFALLVKTSQGTFAFSVGRIFISGQTCVSRTVMCYQEKRRENSYLYSSSDRMLLKMQIRPRMTLRPAGNTKLLRSGRNEQSNSLEGVKIRHALFSGVKRRMRTEKAVFNEIYFDS